MGKRDVALARYFDDDDRYADLINGFVFGGEPVVAGGDVAEKNILVTGVLGRLKSRFMVQKYRDVVKRVVFGMNFAVIALENQDLVHYAMPVRIMLEDAAGYDEQMRRIQRRNHRSNHRARGLKRGEFISGFKKEDRLNAIFTIVLYYGEEPWDGARDLRSLINFEGIPEVLKDMVNDYRLHILEVRRFKETDCFRTDLREVFEFLGHSGDKEAERSYVFQNQDKFERLSEDAYDVIAVMAQSKELEDVKEKYREKGRRINMCDAIRGMIEDGRMEGRLEAKQTVARNMYLRGMKEEDAAGLCEEDIEVVKSWFQEWRLK